MKSETTPELAAQSVFDRLCDDPEVWATHGMPSSSKEVRIVAAIADAIREASDTAPDPSILVRFGQLQASLITTNNHVLALMKRVAVLERPPQTQTPAQVPPDGRE